MAPWGGDPVDAMAKMTINDSDPASKDNHGGNTTARTPNEYSDHNEPRSKETPQQHGWPVAKQLNYALINAPFSENAQDGLSLASPLSRYDPTRHVAENGEYVVDKDIEDALFATAKRTQAGSEIKTYGDYKVHISAKQLLKEMDSFDDPRIDPAVQANIKKLQYSEPLPIQSFAMPYIFQGNDVLAAAQTGSGKTAAYLIPILSKLLANDGKLINEKPNPATFDPRVDYYVSEPSTIVLVPTRELAIQIGDQVAALAYRTKIRYCLAYGGTPRTLQIQDIHRGCDILIGTPGRVKDIVHNAADKLSLRKLLYVVFDEADELIQEDWKNEINGILSVSSADETGTYLMFSATFPPESRKVARQFLSDERMTMCIGRYGSTTANIRQVIIWANQNLKKAATYDLLNCLPVVPTIIFCNTKYMADELDDYLHGKGMPCNVIHADRTQREREMAMIDFRNKDAPILITTSVAARGLDLPDVHHVINFDLPSADRGGIVEYTHRIGRTGRIGNPGQATSLYNDRNEDMGPDLARILLENKHQLPDFLECFAPPDTEPLYEQEDLTGEDDFDIGNDEGHIGSCSETAGGQVASWGDSGTTPAPADNDPWATSGGKAAAAGEDKGWSSGW